MNWNGSVLPWIRVCSPRIELRCIYVTLPARRCVQLSAEPTADAATGSTSLISSPPDAISAPHLHPTGCTAGGVLPTGSWPNTPLGRSMAMGRAPCSSLLGCHTAEPPGHRAASCHSRAAASSCRVASQLGCHVAWPPAHRARCCWGRGRHRQEGRGDGCSSTMGSRWEGRAREGVSGGRDSGGEGRG